MTTIPKLPGEVLRALELLESAEFEAYTVGGCVRDGVMGISPGDFDITTSATPPETESIFKDYKLIETGIKHGTVTVLINGMPLEITTYRVDGQYSDCRRPDSVSFTGSLREDLARRDFTCNAMAYSPQRGLVDIFGGINDVEARAIRAVGNPDARFQEDPLRIMRALRFSSVLDFDIEPSTAESIRRNAELLHTVSGERLAAELKKLLCGKSVGRVIRDFCGVFGIVVDGLSAMEGFQQHNIYHIYDVLEHTIKVIENVPPVPALRIAAMLHDVGKPDCFTIDEAGVGHFYGHADKSIIHAERFFARMKLDNASVKLITELVKRHDVPIQPDERSVLRQLRRMGEQPLRALLSLKRADALGQNPKFIARLGDIDKVEQCLNKVLDEQKCFSIKQLAIRGNDLINIGYTPGPCLGEALSDLTELVIDGKLQNSADELLYAAEKMLKNTEEI